MAHHIAGALIVCADHHPIWTFEIIDRGPLAQKFRVRDHSKLRVGTALADQALDLIAGADGDGRFGDNDRKALDQVGDLLGCGIDIGQVRMAVAPARRGPHGDEHGICPAHGSGGVGREEQPFFAYIGLNKRL